MKNIEIRNGNGMSGNQPFTRRQRRRIKSIGVVAAVAVCAAGAAFVPLSGTTQAQGALSQGMLCTTGTGSSTFSTPAATTNRVFDLHAKTGYTSEPDGNSIYDWSYTARAAFQLPGPVMCANVGDTIEVHLTNDLPVATSIQFPGQSNVTYRLMPAAPADSVPVAPVADTTTGELTSLVQGAQPGETAVYVFKATAAGTYLYQSGTDPQLQVQMGLFGALVVYPNVGVTGTDVGKILNDSTGKTNSQMGVDTTAVAADATCAYLTPGTASCDPLAVFETDRENILMLSEVDPGLHSYMEQNAGDPLKLTWNAFPGAYAPHYYMINGRSMPDTIAPNNAPWLPSQPYGSLATVQPWTIQNPLDAMLRYIAVGVTGYDFHPHSNHEHVIAQDGALMKGLVNGTVVNDNTEEKFNLLVGPGSTLDATFRWTNEEGYSDTTGSRVPVVPPQSLNLTEGDFWSGSPYLGSTGQLNPGILGKTQCGEYYHVAHSHDLSQVTNYGITFGGMLTLIKVEPTPTAGNDFDLKCNG